MAAKDVYPNTVIVALEKESWLITHNPLILEFSSGRL
ncbi:element excision factor XisH family protein [Lusitaniella coriacea]